VNVSLDISSTSLPSLICVDLSARARQCCNWSEALPHSSEAMLHLEFNFYSSSLLKRSIHPPSRRYQGPFTLPGAEMADSSPSRLDRVAFGQDLSRWSPSVTTYGAHLPSRVTFTVTRASAPFVHLACALMDGACFCSLTWRRPKACMLAGGTAAG
jgi:hypothetical protein